MKKPITIARSAIKSIDIKAPFDEVFSFISNPLNWPQYAIINMMEGPKFKGTYFADVPVPWSSVHTPKFNGTRI